MMPHEGTTVEAAPDRAGRQIRTTTHIGRGVDKSQMGKKKTQSREAKMEQLSTKRDILNQDDP